MRQLGVYSACLLLLFACGDDPPTGPGGGEPPLDFPSPDDPDRRPEPDQRDVSRSTDANQADLSASPDTGQPNPGPSVGPCFDVIGPNPILLGPVAPGVAASDSIRVINCAAAELVVDHISLVGHDTLPGLDRFQVTAPDPDAAQPTLNPGEGVDVALSYVPADTGDVDGSVLIVRGIADSGELGVVERNVIGRAEGAPGCADLVAEGRPSGAEVAWQTHVDVAPLTAVELRARSGDTEVSAEWEFLVRPAGSTRGLSTSSGNRPQMVTDVAGGYAMRALSTTVAGEICVSSPLTITAEPPGPLYVELTWDTPRDLDPSDRDGSDLDLHFLHPNGTWNELPWDCFWRNTEPNWGDPGRADNPQLDIDDTNGAGPEVISADDLPATAALDELYRVGVHAFSDHGWGDSTPTVRIYVGGQLRLEASAPLQSRQFWEVASFDWPIADLTLINRIHPSGFP